MNYMISGGLTSYGHLVGILMNDSTIPRIPGDPGHAQTFSFPVLYEVLEGFPFQDLIDAGKENMDILIEKAVRLEQRGVKLIAADCGLFGPYREMILSHLSIPFIGSALDIVPLLLNHLPHTKKIGVITGDSRILGPVHFEASGVDPESIVLAGMEDSEEFNRVVLNGENTLDVQLMRKGVIKSAQRLVNQDVHAVVLECTNLIPFRKDIQNVMKRPVYDLVSLIEFYVSGFTKRSFSSDYISR
jgi:aspartate/glutamate racemase